MHYTVFVYVLSVPILAQTFGWILSEALGRLSTSIARCCVVAMPPRQRVKLSNKETEQIKEGFDLYDTDGSGSLDKKGFKDAMRALGFEPKANEIDKITALAFHEDGRRVAYYEFVMTMTAKFLEPKDLLADMKKAFRLLDHDGTGTISLKNLKRTNRELQMGWTDDALQQMIDEADRDGTGEVNEEEFLRMIASETNLRGDLSI